MYSWSRPEFWVRFRVDFRTPCFVALPFLGNPLISGYLGILTLCPLTPQASKRTLFCLSCSISTVGQKFLNGSQPMGFPSFSAYLLTGLCLVILQCLQAVGIFFICFPEYVGGNILVKSFCTISRSRTPWNVTLSLYFNFLWHFIMDLSLYISNM